MKVNFVRRFPSVADGRMPKEIYLERAPGQPFFTFYVTMADPEIYTSSITEARITQLIADKVSDSSKFVFLENFEAWNEAERPVSDALVFIKDATEDPDFTGEGGMSYRYIHGTDSLVPTFRLPEDPYTGAWSGMTSTPQAVDDAVAASHRHDNKSVLDGFGSMESEAGDKVLTWDGKPIGLVLVDPAW